MSKNAEYSGMDVCKQQTRITHGSVEVQEQTATLFEPYPWQHQVTQPLVQRLQLKPGDFGPRKHAFQPECVCVLFHGPLELQRGAPHNGTSQVNAEDAVQPRHKPRNHASA